MSESRDTGLYQPATELEIRDFSNKLLRVSEQLARGDGYHYKVEVDRRASLPDDSCQTVRFLAEYATNFYTLSVGWSRATPLRSIWQTVHAESMYGEEGMALEVSDVLISPEDEVVEGSDTVEGYLEQERNLKIMVGPEEVDASMTYLVNLLDDSFLAVDCSIGYGPDIFVSNPEQEARDIEMLIKYGEALMDMESREAEQSAVTRADLIIAAGVLQGCGLMHPLTKAYRGAPKSVDSFRGLEEVALEDDFSEAWTE